MQHIVIHTIIKILMRTTPTYVVNNGREITIADIGKYDNNIVECRNIQETVLNGMRQYDKIMVVQ